MTHTFTLKADGGGYKLSSSLGLKVELTPKDSGRLELRRLCERCKLPNGRPRSAYACRLCSRVTMRLEQEDRGGVLQETFEKWLTGPLPLLEAILEASRVAALVEARLSSLAAYQAHQKKVEARREARQLKKRGLSRREVAHELRQRERMRNLRNEF